MNFALHKIHVRFISVLAQIAGKSNMVLDLEAGETLEDLLSKLRAGLGDEFEKKVWDGKNVMNPFVLILVNGIDSRNIGGLKKTLNDGDRVEFLPAIAGG